MKKFHTMKKTCIGFISLHKLIWPDPLKYSNLQNYKSFWCTNISEPGQHGDFQRHSINFDHNCNSQKELGRWNICWWNICTICWWQVLVGWAINWQISRAAVLWPDQIERGAVLTNAHHQRLTSFVKGNILAQILFKTCKLVPLQICTSTPQVWVVPKN